MAQLSLYIDEETLHGVEQAARQNHESVSKWVRRHLQESLSSEWPPDYFSLFGAVSDNSFLRPEQPSTASDLPREPL